MNKRVLLRCAWRSLSCKERRQIRHETQMDFGMNKRPVGFRDICRYMSNG